MFTSIFHPFDNFIEHGCLGRAILNIEQMNIKICMPQRKNCIALFLALLLKNFLAFLYARNFRG